MGNIRENLINFNFKKSLGQNFLIDQNILNNIIALSNVDKETLVIEIGVGAGSLTAKIAEYAKQVIGYEIDKRLESILKEKLSSCENIKVIYDDFLKRELNDDISPYKYKKLYVIANLPYYITTPIILKFINEKIIVDKMIIMVQKEVGDRINASPRTRDYNSLTVFLNYFFNIKKLFNVSKNSFIPKPKVDSVMLELSKKEVNDEVIDEDLLFRVIRDSFRYKRKNLRNNLKEYNLEVILEALSKYNLDLTVRAEYLTLEQFIVIANQLKLSEWKFNFFLHIII